MARGIVRSVGDIIAMVVATTKEQAINAAELIEVNYEPLPAITDVDSALEADAPQLYPDYPGNKVFHWRVGNHEEALHEFNTADLKTDRIVELSVVNNRIAPNAMEM